MSAQRGLTVAAAAFTLAACSVYDSSLLATNPIVAGGAAGAGAGGTAGAGASVMSAGAGAGSALSGAGADSEDAGAPSSGGTGGSAPSAGSGGVVSGGSGGAGAGGAQPGGGAGPVTTAGTSGEGGSAGKVVLALENIDTMEDNNGAIEAPRNGDWYAGHDTTPTGVQTPGAVFAMTALPTTDARYNATTDKYAAMTKGAGFNAWGEDMGFNIMLVDPTTMMHPAYDATGYCGIHFYGRTGVGTNNTVIVRVPDKNSLPDGGQCGAVDKPCYEYFQKVYSFNNSWTEYNILFSQLKGTGWPASLDLAHIYSIEFGLAAASGFELWIDDISFLKKPTGGVCPTSYP